MKHILNNLTEEEKNSIRLKHAGGMKVVTESFDRLTKSKLGDVKPLLNEDDGISYIYYTDKNGKPQKMQVKPGPGPKPPVPEGCTKIEKSKYDELIKSENTKK